MADALIIGDGVIALASALAIARAGGSCRVLGRFVTGAASAASACLLAPSIGSADPAFRSFMVAARDLYPAWVHWLAERTGIEVTLNRLGIIELEADASAADANTPRRQRLPRAALEELEPAIAGREAFLYENDGYVD
ncbi:MAG TPA: FAD-dependent oxidoreductase, partial [Gemmatimonadaceae bacterium]|nr:FAD-dependent oxidoreductase [Gemmatimonadaceae bacterium]